MPVSSGSQSIPQASRPSLPSTVSIIPSSHSNPLPATLASQNLPSGRAGKRRPFSHKKGKEKAPRLVTWDRSIVCLPQGYGACGNSRVIPIPKGKARTALQARGLCGKIRLHSEMTEDEVVNEVRSTFNSSMGHDNNFPFRFLQTGGGGTKSLTVPVVSALFTWTAKEVAKLSGQGCLYIEAEAELMKTDSDSGSEKEIDLTEGEVNELEVYKCMCSSVMFNTLLSCDLPCVCTCLPIVSGGFMLMIMQETTDQPPTGLCSSSAHQPCTAQGHARLQPSLFDRDKVLFLYRSVFTSHHM